MVTYAQAQELAEEWINGGVPHTRQREVRVREFDLGFVCWAVAPAGPAEGTGGAGGGSGEARLVIARDSGASTLWPALPVNEVVRQYEEVYGRPVAANPAGAAKPAPGPVEATSFLLSPPQWLQEAGAAAIAAEAERLGTAPAAAAAAEPVEGATTPAPQPVPAAQPVQPTPAVLTEPPVSDRPAGDAPTMLAPPPGQDEPAVVPQPAPVPVPQAAVPVAPDVPAAPATPVPPAAPAAPATPVPPVAPVVPGPPAGAEAATMLMPEGLRTTGSDLPEPAAPAGAEAATMLMPPTGGGYGMPPVPPSAPAPAAAEQPPVAPPAPVPAPAAEPAPTLLASPDAMPGLMGLPGAPAAPPAGGPQVEHAPTMLAPPGGLPGLAGLPGAPAPGAPIPGVPAPGAPEGGVPQAGLGRGAGSAPPPPPPAALRGGPAGPPAAGGAPAGLGRNAGSGPPPPPPAGLKHTPGSGTPVASPGGRGAATAPPPPPPAGLRGGEAPPTASAAGPAASGTAYEATQLASAIDPALVAGPADPGTPPSGGPAVPPPPGGPAAPVAPAAGYGYPNAGGAAGLVPPAAVPGSPQPAPVPPGVPAVGPGYFAALSYRGPDGSEQKLLHRSEPGTPHPEWKILQDLRRLNVPPEQVLELYTELESCDLPGGYCNRMIAASWPNVRLTHTAPYGRDHASRQAGMSELLDHLDELHQLASGAQRVRPFRVPASAPGTVQALPPLPPQQLAQEIGAAFGQNLFRYEQRAVSRQGVPEPVSQTLMWAGLPRDFGPFFWAQAQEGRPIPTLAELAAERGLAAGPDFGGYLVLGNDYGRQLCVQYGTAHVVAVDIDGTGQPPRFVNSGVPEFVRSMALLGRMWRLRYGLTPDQAGRWTTDFQAQLAAIDPAALQNADTWWAVLLEQFWDGLL